MACRLRVQTLDLEVLQLLGEVPPGARARALEAGELFLQSFAEPGLSGRYSSRLRPTLRELQELLSKPPVCGRLSARRRGVVALEQEAI